MLPSPRVRGEGLGVRAPTLPRPASKRRLAAFALTGGLCVHTILQLVSPDSLPYTVLILLVELAVGSLATVTLFDARRMVTMGYVQMGALIVVCSALLALWTVSGRVPTAEVDGYLLDVAWIGPLKVLLLVFSAVSGVHTAAAFADQRRVTMMLGVAGSVLGLVLVGLLAGLVGASAWSYVGVLASMLGAALGILYALVLRVFFPQISVPGWTLLIVAVLFLGGIQSLSIGVIGSYVGRIYTEVQARPLYLLRERRGPQ